MFKNIYLENSFRKESETMININKDIEIDSFELLQVKYEYFSEL